MEAVLEQPQISADLAQLPQTKPKAKPRGRAFTPEQAKLAALKSNEAQRARKLLPAPQTLPSVTHAVLTQVEPYLSEASRKAYIRRLEGQLTALYALRKGAIEGNVRELGDEGEVLIIDPKGIKALSDSIASTESVFWRYAQVHGEGTLKPTSPKERPRVRIAPREPT